MQKALIYGKCWRMPKNENPNLYVPHSYGKRVREFHAIYEYCNLDFLMDKNNLKFFEISEI